MDQNGSEFQTVNFSDDFEVNPVEGSGIGE
jgi:hypothetical protein